MMCSSESKREKSDRETSNTYGTENEDGRCGCIKERGWCLSFFGVCKNGKRMGVFFLGFSNLKQRKLYFFPVRLNSLSGCWSTRRFADGNILH
jgi:hypothetical protein